MNFRPLPCAVLLASCLLSAEAAVTITIAPDGLGGTTYAFTQTAPNPTMSVEMASTGDLRMDLPPGMFDPMVRGGDGMSDIYGSFEILARFRDLYSGVSYDVVGMVISHTLSYASFGFQRPFASRLSQTEAQFELFPGAAGALGISPMTLVAGTHSVGSLLFGTVTVSVIREPSSLVIPEPSSLVLLLLGAVALTKRRRENADRIGRE